MLTSKKKCIDLLLFTFFHMPRMLNSVLSAQQSVLRAKQVCCLVLSRKISKKITLAEAANFFQLFRFLFIYFAIVCDLPEFFFSICAA